MAAQSMATAGRTALAAACAIAVLALGLGGAQARPITTKEGVLPFGTDLNEGRLKQPTELFNFERAGGKRSYLFNLGDMLFSAPAIFGGPARKAGMSCNTCHQQGAGNAKLYVPGMSSRPGTFDATNALFNPKTDNGVLDVVTPPSLRGAKYLAPYGHDGRFGTLRDFIRHVIVGEFAGPEPTPQVLDALVTYVREISFLPNAKLASGRLTDRASDSARRGEMLFNKPFRSNAAMSCASCHQPTSAFVDHRVHDVGTGGLFKTPTLINANFNAPYFHDGRYDSYGQVVAYFDRHFDLGFSNKDKSDLVAYLKAVGDANTPSTADTVQTEIDELADFASVLETAIPAHDKAVIALAVDSVGHEWRELGENFPERSDTSVHGGLAERLKARGAVRGLVLSLRRIAMAASRDDFAGAAQAYADYRQLAAAAAPKLKVAERWSLFNPTVRQAHFRALRQLAALAQ
jgi:cytochrome c peroxidase